MSRLRSHVPVLMSEACLALSQLCGTKGTRSIDSGPLTRWWGRQAHVPPTAVTDSPVSPSKPARSFVTPGFWAWDSPACGPLHKTLPKVIDKSREPSSFTFSEVTSFSRMSQLFNNPSPPRKFIEIVPCPRISPTWQSCTWQVANPFTSQIWVMSLEYSIYYVMPKASSIT